MTDALADILALLKPTRRGAGAVRLGGDWDVRFPAQPGVRCYVVGRGECWAEIAGFGAPRRVVQDDCLLITGSVSFRLGSASQAGRDLLDDEELFTGDRISSVNDGGSCVIVGGHFTLDAMHEQLLTSALPPFAIVRDPGLRGSLGSALKALWVELEAPQPGSRLVIDHLNQIMLIFALRLIVSSDGQRPAGWLSALADDRIARALTAIHASPEKAWTLHALALEAGMSRTVFTERFSTLVGATPMAYILHWRMATAAYHLGNANMSVEQVAHAIGYGSGTAFSTAFRRAYGIPPSVYAREAISRRSLA